MKLSIAMCTYNGARHIREQLDSIAMQSRPPDELVICDDCSDADDATCDVIREFARTVSFPVHLHVNRKNLGSTQNFGRAIALCTGDVIALADQDDVWQEHKLATLIEGFSSSPEIGAVFADACVVDERLGQSGYTFKQCINFGETERRMLDGGRGFELLVGRSLISGATMAFRSKYKELILPIPANVNHMIHDAWIAIIISAVAKIKYLDATLQLYRQHPGQQMGIKLPAESEPPHGWRRFTTDNLGVVASELERLGIVNERLSAMNGRFGSKETDEYVTKKTLHLRARLTARQVGRARRVPLLLREFLTLRYHRHSNGTFSFGKDLVIGRVAHPFEKLRTPPEPIV